MADISQILNTFNTSPSVELLRLRNREMIVEFLVQTFINKQVAISSENIHTQLADFLEEHEVENDQDNEISAFDTYIDEAFKAQDEDKARYLNTLCKQLHLQLLVVTPSDNIHIVENDISFVHFVERKEERHSWLYDMPIEQFKEEKANYLNQ